MQADRLKHTDDGRFIIISEETLNRAPGWAKKLALNQERLVFSLEIQERRMAELERQIETLMLSQQAEPS